jgi:hypothetical protein
MNNPKVKPQQGPDPAVMQAIQRLVQTQLSPLEEVIFNSWMQANQLEEDPSMPFDYRGLYQQTGGKVFAPGELSQQVAHQNAIQTLMQAQEQHDSMSPIKHLMDAGGDPSVLGGGQPQGQSQLSGDPQQDFGDGMDYSGGDMGGGFDNPEESF